jgi:hypothetical protein
LNLSCKNGTVHPKKYKYAEVKNKEIVYYEDRSRSFTADNLEWRVWPYRGICQLCKQQNEIAAHLLFSSRYSLRIWRWIKVGFGLMKLNLKK